MARTRFQHRYKKLSYTSNGNSKSTHETVKKTSSINKETTTTTDNQDKTGRERIQRSHIILFSPSKKPDFKTNGMVCSTITNDKKSMENMNLTGRFKHFSASDYGYLLVSYNYDDNAILVDPL